MLLNEKQDSAEETCHGANYLKRRDFFFLDENRRHDDEHRHQCHERCRNACICVPYCIERERNAKKRTADAAQERIPHVAFVLSHAQCRFPCSPERYEQRETRQSDNGSYL